MAKLVSGFQYKCHTCEQLHDGFPALGFAAPTYFHSIPEGERAKRCSLDEDLCSIDDEYFFVRCTLEYRVLESDEILSWGIWGSLSKDNFKSYLSGKFKPGSHLFSYLSNELKDYPDSLNLPCDMCIAPAGTRPSLHVHECDNQLFRDQQNGVPFERALEIVRPFVSWHSRLT